MTGPVWFLWGQLADTPFTRGEALLAGWNSMDDSERGENPRFRDVPCTFERDELTGRHEIQQQEPPQPLPAHEEPVPEPPAPQHEEPAAPEPEPAQPQRSCDICLIGTEGSGVN